MDASSVSYAEMSERLLEESQQRELQRLERTITESEFAAQLQLSIKTIRRIRYAKQGPKCVYAGKLVRYRPSDVEAWLTTRTRGGRQHAAS